MTITTSEFKSIFLDDTDVSEDITYTASGSVAKSIKAVVYRGQKKYYKQLGDRGMGSNKTYYSVEIKISRDATEGIQTITEREDTVSLSLNKNGTATVFTVSSIIQQANGFWHLGLQA